MNSNPDWQIESGFGLHIVFVRIQISIWFKTVFMHLKQSQCAGTTVTSRYFGNITMMILHSECSLRLNPNSDPHKENRQPESRIMLTTHVVISDSVVERDNNVCQRSRIHCDVNARNAS